MPGIDSHDITITDGASVETGFMLYREDRERPAWERKRAPILPPSERTGQATASLTPIGTDFTWEMNDFSCGMGRYRWSPTDSASHNEYAFSDGVVSDVQGELSLGASVREAAIILRNPGGELGAATGWSVSGTITAAGGTSPNTGKYSLKLTFSGSGVGTVFQDVANDAVLRSVSVTIHVMAKKLSGAAVETLNLYIDDGVATTNGTGVVLTSAYQLLTVTRTIDALSTKLNIGVNRAATTDGASEIHLDDFLVLGPGQTSIKKFITHAGSLFACNDNLLFHWNTTTEVFDPVYYTTTTITDIASYAGYLFLGRGTAAAYAYATAPQTAAPSMIASTLATNGGRDDEANYFLKVRQFFWKVRNTDKAAYNANTDATDIINGGAGWTELAIGDSQQNFTNLVSFNDVPVACKADGFFVYDRENTAFFDVSPEFAQQPSATNFTPALSWRGWVYFGVHEHAFMRYDGVNFQEMGFLVEYPQFDDFSGKILALASDARHLYAMVDTLDVDFATTETTFLLSLQEVRIGDAVSWIVHTEHELELGGTVMAMLPFSNNLFVGGGRKPTTGTTEGAHAYRIGLPTRGVPAHSRSFDLRHSAPFITPWWDGGYPDLKKALRTLQVRMPDSLPATETLKVEIQIDADTSFTNMTTLSSPGWQTISIETVASAQKSAQRVRFRLTLNSGTDNALPRVFPTTGPIIRLPIILHTTPMPSRDDEITMQVYVADHLPLKSGARELESPASRLTILNAYIDSATFPLTLKEDLDRDGVLTTRRVVVTSVAERKQFDHDKYGHVWVYQLTCTEVPV